MDLPKKIKTKAEAETLAGQIFPAYKAARAAIERKYPAEDYPFPRVDFMAADELRAVLHWLLETKPTVYKRARFYLFWEFTDRFQRLIKENTDAKHDYWHWLYSAQDRDRRQRADLLTGDGAGI